MRLKDFDYSETGAYFVTICTRNRKCLFGDVVNDEMVLNKIGVMVHESWDELSNRFPGIELDQFIVMPNHIHGIVHIVGAQFIAPRYSQGAMNRAPTMGEIVRTFKAVSTYRIRRTVYSRFRWQRNYHDRIIRNEYELNLTREYIQTNPLRWDLDRENPKNPILR